MTKKHFIALADRIRMARKNGQFQNGEVLELAEFCRSMNYGFNRERWLDYIDGKSGPSGGRVSIADEVAK